MGGIKTTLKIDAHPGSRDAKRTKECSMERQFNFYIQKVNGETVNAQQFFDGVTDYLNNNPDGSYEGSCKRSRKHKSKQQLGAIFGLALNTIKAEFDDRGWDTSYLLKITDPTGNEISIDFLKEYLYATCGVYNEKGLVRLSRANTLQAAQFFDAIRNYAVTQWGIYVPEPDKSWRNKISKSTDDPKGKDS